MNNARLEIRLPKALKKKIDKQPNGSEFCRSAIEEKLEREKKEEDEYHRDYDPYQD